MISWPWRFETVAANDGRIRWGRKTRPLMARIKTEREGGWELTLSSKAHPKDPNTSRCGLALKGYTTSQ